MSWYRPNYAWASMKWGLAWLVFATYVYNSRWWFPCLVSDPDDGPPKSKLCSLNYVNNSELWGDYEPVYASLTASGLALAVLVLGGAFVVAVVFVMRTEGR